MKYSVQNHHKIPVLSSIKGVGEAVREKLRSSSSSLGDLYRSCRLEVVDIPVPLIVQQQEQQNHSIKEWYLNETQKKILKEATILLGDSNLCAPLLLSSSSFSSSMSGDLLKNIQWVQSTFAGIEPFLEASRRQEQKPTFQLTRAGGIMGLAMAQYVLGWIVALERKFFEAKEYQKQHVFAQEELKYRPFNSLTVGILGFGDIGMDIGKLLKASGFRVIGLKRKLQVMETSSSGSSDSTMRPMHLAAHRVTENLQDVLEQSDYLVSCLPSTPSTHHLLTTNLLTNCIVKKPVLINVGRGDLIEEKTLIEALERQFLSKVVLDVFEKEPLPIESALWDHPKVIMTPHIAAKSFPQDIAHVFVQNLEKFLLSTDTSTNSITSGTRTDKMKNKKLLYQVDWKKGY